MVAVCLSAARLNGRMVVKVIDTCSNYSLDPWIQMAEFFVYIKTDDDKNFEEFQENLNSFLKDNPKQMKNDHRLSPTPSP